MRLSYGTICTVCLPWSKMIIGCRLIKSRWWCNKLFGLRGLMTSVASSVACALLSQALCYTQILINVRGLGFAFLVLLLSAVFQLVKTEFVFSVGRDHCRPGRRYSDHPGVCPHLAATWAPPPADPDCTFHGKSLWLISGNTLDTHLHLVWRNFNNIQKVFTTSSSQYSRPCSLWEMLWSH